MLIFLRRPRLRHQFNAKNFPCREGNAAERLTGLCYDVAKPMKECGCQETVFTNSLVGTKTGGRPLDGRLEISNNRAERSIKPFVMGRKNFLFANVPRGAETSAIIYSLIETAKENGLDPYRYLTWLMREAPKLDMRADEQVARLMPVNAPEECRVRKSV